MGLEIYELKVGFECAGQYAACIFNLRVDNISNVDDYTVAKQIRESLDDGVPPNRWTDKLCACLSQNSFISSVAAKRFDPTGGNSSPQAFEPADFPGAVAEDMHTGQVSGVCVWLADTDTGNTGRTFLPGVPETFLESSRWTGDAQTAYDEFIARHILGFNVAAGECVPVIYTRETTTSRQITQGYLSQKAGTQRRREKPI